MVTLVTLITLIALNSNIYKHTHTILKAYSHELISLLLFNKTSHTTGPLFSDPSLYHGNFRILKILSDPSLSSSFFSDPSLKSEESLGL